VISRSILNRNTADAAEERTARRRRPSAADAGFTLIEVMIAIVLLVMISVAIYQATTQTYRYRAKIINEGDFYSGIRLAMGLMDRDLAALFSPVNMNPNTTKQATGTAVDDPASGDPNARGIVGVPPKRGAPTPGDAQDAERMENLTRSDLGQLSDYWLPATDLTAIRPSRFVGTDTRIQFVSASHMRLYKNYRESDYAKIVYELRDDKDTQVVEGTRLLVKIEDSQAFDDDKSFKKEKNARIYPLLPGVKSVKFRYFRRDKKTWENSWDTSRDDMKGLYPDLIEVKIEVVGLNKLSFTGSYMFKPETPFYGLESTL
jgi:prepilin-type N-terminal cleavage/methylation domain-containing protein